jgi:hypothetical protein
VQTLIDLSTSHKHRQVADSTANRLLQEYAGKQQQQQKETQGRRQYERDGENRQDGSALQSQERDSTATVKSAPEHKWQPLVGGRQTSEYKDSTGYWAQAQTAERSLNNCETGLGNASRQSKISHHTEVATAHQLLTGGSHTVRLMSTNHGQQGSTAASLGSSNSGTSTQRSCRAKQVCEQSLEGRDRTSSNNNQGGARYDSGTYRLGNDFSTNAGRQLQSETVEQPGNSRQDGSETQNLLPYTMTATRVSPWTDVQPRQVDLCAVSRQGIVTSNNSADSNEIHSQEEIFSANAVAQMSPEIQSHFAWNTERKPTGYNRQIIRVSACKRGQTIPMFKAHFRDKSKSQWVTINEEIPPQVLSNFYVKSFQRKKRRMLRV